MHEQIQAPVGSAGVLVILIVISAISSGLMRYVGRFVAAKRPLRAWSAFIMATGMNIASFIVFVAVEVMENPTIGIF